MSKETAMAYASQNVSPTPTQTAPIATPEASPSGPSAAPANNEAFNHLAKKEAELVRMREEYKRDRAALNADIEKMRPAKAEYDEYLVAKQKDPVAALKKLGFTEQDIMNYLAAEEKPELTPEQKAQEIATKTVQEQMKAFEEAQNKKQLEAQAAADQRTIQDYKSGFGVFLGQNKEQYEVLDYFGPDIITQMAYDEAVKSAKESNGQKIATYAEIMSTLEKDFEGVISDMTSKINKFKPKDLEPKAIPAEPSRERTVTPGYPNQPQPNPTVQRTRTLSNTATTTVASTRQTSHETSAQKRERLMSALRNGKL